jgi:hypothetical protein
VAFNPLLIYLFVLYLMGTSMCPKLEAATDLSGEQTAGGPSAHSGQSLRGYSASLLSLSG